MTSLLVVLLVVTSGCGSAGTSSRKASPAPTLDQGIDAYIDTLSTPQLIGQMLMLAVYASSDTASLNQALASYHFGSAIVYDSYNGGPLQPTTLVGMKALVAGLKSHAQTPLLLAVDEEGGEVDRLAPYYGSSPSAQQLAATGNSQIAYAQARMDAERMKAIGLNADFAPVVDVYQGVRSSGGGSHGADAGGTVRPHFGGSASHVCTSYSTPQSTAGAAGAAVTGE